MPKFIVAQSGKTIDGREITATQIDEMAESYHPETYGARIWLEHLRSLLPDGDFKAYGDVLALEAADKDGKRVLIADIAPSDELKEMNKKRQKLYTSIEMHPNLEATGGAYLVGLAVTDSPASLGTQQLNFSAMSQVQIFSDYFDAGLHFDDEDQSGLLSKIKAMFSKHGDSQAKDSAAVAQRFTDNEQAVTEVAAELLNVKAEINALNAEIIEVKNEFKAIDQSPALTPTRPQATGANFNLTDC